MSSHRLPWLREMLVSQSMPQLTFGLPDIDFAFPIRGHSSNPKPKEHRSSSSSLLKKRLQAATKQQLISVNGKASSDFNAKLEMVMKRPLSEILRIKEPIRTPKTLSRTGNAFVIKRFSALTTAVRETETELRKRQKELGPMIFFQNLRDLYANALNAMLQVDAKYFASHSSFVSLLFSRYDELYNQYRKFVIQNEHRSEARSSNQLKSLKCRLSSVEKQLEQANVEKAELKQLLQNVEDKSSEQQHELEKYRKYVFVKTGMLNLHPQAWSKLIANADLPSIDYMNKEHPTHSVVLKAKLANKEKMPMYLSDDDEDDDDIEHQYDCDSGKKITQDCLDELDRRTGELLDVLDSTTVEERRRR